MLDISAVKCGASTTRVVDVFDATGILCAPFEVALYDSVQQVIDVNGEVIETIIPDPAGLVRAVAFLRALHPQKLDCDDLKFLRSALDLKATALAKKMGVTPEHLSRLESGAKVLQPQSEQQLRTLTVALSCTATKAKDATLAEFSKHLMGIFDDIKPCRLVDDAPLLISLRRDRVDGCDVDTEGLWDENAQVA
ncbi:helix-turn-helix domain-containing protein [Pseudosulfitobacter sp. SM2401]|uniref:helix-turn-helix domain-containing protein n=1 Tax=Pseudosulfitobacter sp. SM2401 TaxID=3350098 RepID=UPI0036F2B795